MAKNYINNQLFEQCIFNYLASSAVYEAQLINLFDLLIHNIINSFKFSGVDKEDASQECFIIVLKTLKNFKPSEGSAFNYFTTVIVNNLKLLYTKQKKYVDKLEDYKRKKFGDILDKPNNGF